MHTRCVGLDSLEEWERYFSRLDNLGMYHDPRYVSLLTGNYESPNEEARLFILEKEGEFVYYPFILRSIDNIDFSEDLDLEKSEYRDIVSTWYYGGPVLSSDDAELANEFKEKFSQYCREKNIVSEFIRFDPNLQNHQDFECLDPEQVLETVKVDLTKTKDEIWEGFEKRNRNAIRQAQEHKLDVEATEDKEDYRKFHEIYMNAMEAKNASGHYIFDYKFFQELADSDIGTLMVIRKEGEVVGGEILVHNEDIAYDYLRASNPDYWDLRINNLLCYGAVMEMKKTGRKIFDFQGGSGGVFKFKKAFSQDRGEFYISKRIHMPEVYRKLVEAQDTESDEDYFPKYRA